VSPPLIPKAFNVLQLVDFVVTHWTATISVGWSMLLAAAWTRFLPANKSSSANSIRQVDHDLLEVPSETAPDVTYLVDMSVGCCGCPVGTTGGPYKHQAAVLNAFKLYSWNTSAGRHLVALCFN